ncbi:HD domain-containing protein [Brucella anthropi]|uniref:HD domain-containing protein n=1 Tax=Brucella anthropi TaxID=529 RepID=UPI003EDFE4F9
MSENLSKVIKDPIHGFIDFNGERENELKLLLSNPFFQRLRRVKQLGFSDYVFPSAGHSRFAHSLGVYKIAKRMLAVVEPKGVSGKWTPKAEGCLAAALLHDVGHGMFSHAFEKAMEFFLSQNQLDDARRAIFEEAVDHEKVSQKIIRQSSVATSLRSFGGDDFPDLVGDLIDKADPNCIYTSIVSSQLDADRLDYAMRDAYFAGVSSGGIDLDWLLRNFRVGTNGAASFLYVDSKAYVSLEQFTVTLFHLYPTIYLHKKTRALEYMFALLLSRAFQLIAEGDWAAAGLTGGHPFVRFFNEPDNLDHARLLDDTVFWASLYQFREASDPTIRKMAGRLSDRQILPIIDIWKIADDVAANMPSILKLSTAERMTLFGAVCKSVAESVRADDGLWTDACYYDHYDRPIYNRKDRIGGHPQQINVKVGEAIVDVASISPMVASAASFNIHRIYYDDQRFQRGRELGARVRDLLKSELAKAAG